MKRLKKLKGLVWKKDISEIYNRLSKWSGEGIWISDLDGTIHKSFIPFLTHGYSNSDLILLLIFPLLVFPGKWFSFYSSCLNMFLKEEIWRLRTNLRIDDSLISNKKRKKLDIFLIEEFSKILSTIPEKIIDDALENITRWIYPGVVESFITLSQNNFSGIIVSKTIQPIVEQYATLLGTHNIKVKGIANPINSTPKILTGEDKVKAIHNYLQKVNSKNHLILIGDSREDLPFFKWGLQAVGKENSLRISIKGSDKVLINESDLIVNSWIDLNEFFHRALPLYRDEYILLNKEV